MITLKNGYKIDYNEDFDVFFQNLLESVIEESRKAAEETYYGNKKKGTFNDIFLKEIMDNSIFVIHQLFEQSKSNRQFSEFILTGFLFNSIILSLPKLKGEDLVEKKDKKDKDIIH